MATTYRGAGRTNRRRNRAARAAKAPLHWQNHPKRASHWGDHEVSAAKVRGRATRIMTPAKDRALRGADQHPATSSRRRDQIEIAQPSTLAQLKRRIFGTKKPS